MQLITKLLFPFLAVTISTACYADTPEHKNHAALGVITEKYRRQCSEFMKDASSKNYDNEATDTRHLSISDDSIYDAVIDKSGKTALILYPKFRCGNLGYPWCGTGGCGFYLFVDGVIFYRRIGFRPQIVQLPNSLGAQIAFIYPIHGANCVTAEQQIGVGTDTCFGLAIWDEQNSTFISQDGQILRENPEMP